MSPLVATPDPPYYAVIFTSIRNDGDAEAYAKTAQRMLELAAQQPGFLGVESVSDPSGTGLTVSYWSDLDSIQKWHALAEHREAQRLGKEKWYAQFQLRVCCVEREYGWQQQDDKNRKQP